MSGLMDLQISDYWWNINSKGDYNHPHDHRDSILSGVYYIDIPKENSSDIKVVGVGGAGGGDGGRPGGGFGGTDGNGGR